MDGVFQHLIEADQILVVSSSLCYQHRAYFAGALHNGSFVPAHPQGDIQPLGFMDIHCIGGASLLNFVVLFSSTKLVHVAS